MLFKIVFYRKVRWAAENRSPQDSNEVWKGVKFSFSNN